LKPYITTLLLENVVVHRSKTVRGMAATGHSRRTEPPQGFAACPLCLRLRPNRRVVV